MSDLFTVYYKGKEIEYHELCEYLKQVDWWNSYRPGDYLIDSEGFLYIDDRCGNIYNLPKEFTYKFNRERIENEIREYN